MSQDELRWREENGEYFCKKCGERLVALSVTEVSVWPARPAGTAYQCQECGWSVVFPNLD
jgi:predicted RNA-binding Zn-ribbon protein involved in translation (DUF1610 family)